MLYIFCFPRRLPLSRTLCPHETSCNKRRMALPEHKRHQAPTTEPLTQCATNQCANFLLPSLRKFSNPFSGVLVCVGEKCCLGGLVVMSVRCGRASPGSIPGPDTKITVPVGDF